MNKHSITIALMQFLASEQAYALGLYQHHRQSQNIAVDQLNIMVNPDPAGVLNAAATLMNGIEEAAQNRGTRASAITQAATVRGGAAAPGRPGLPGGVHPEAAGRMSCPDGNL